MRQLCNEASINWNQVWQKFHHVFTQKQKIRTLIKNRVIFFDFTYANANRASSETCKGLIEICGSECSSRAFVVYFSRVQCTSSAFFQQNAASVCATLQSNSYLAYFFSSYVFCSGDSAPLRGELWVWNHAISLHPFFGSGETIEARNAISQQKKSFKK